MTADIKRRENLRALCALAGIAMVDSLDEIGTTVFIVSDERIGWTKELRDLDAVEQHLHMVTGRRSEGAPSP